MDATRSIANRETTIPTLIGAFFAARIAATLICARWLGLDPQIGAVVQILLGALLLLLLCFHSLRPSTFSLHEQLRQPATRWVLAYLAFALISFAWTGAVSPVSSFAYWCSLAVDAATILLLSQNDRSVAQAHAVLRGFIYASSTLGLIAWIMPVQDDLRLGDMDYFNTNQIGNLCAVAFFFAQYLERSETGRWTLLKLFLLITLVRSLSKTTLVAMLVSQCVLFLRDNSVSRNKKIGIMLASLLALALFWGLFAAYFTIYTTTGNQAETLTGRTTIWLFAINAALTKPWFGNGFDALWHVIPPFGPDRFEARHAENELLQQFFAYGAAGVVLLVGLYNSFHRLARRIRQRPRRLVLLSLLLYIVVRGLAESEPFDLLLPLWSILLFSALSSNEAAEQHQPHPQTPGLSARPAESTS